MVILSSIRLLDQSDICPYFIENKWKGIWDDIYEELTKFWPKKKLFRLMNGCSIMII